MDKPSKVYQELQAAKEFGLGHDDGLNGVDLAKNPTLVYRAGYACGQKERARRQKEQEKKTYAAADNLA
jgi:hypothetical protein